MVPGEVLARVTVPGEPTRSAHKPVMRGGHISTRPDPKWRDWRAMATARLRIEWGCRATLTVPVLVSVVAVFSRPKSKKRHYTVDGHAYPYPWPWDAGRVPYVGTPDWDQIGKAGVDVVKQSGILADDPLVVGVCAPFERWYAAVGERPSVTVTLFAVVVEDVP